MVSGPECPSQCHLQTTTHSSSHVTRRLSVPCLSHIHALSSTSLQPFTAFVCLFSFPLPDHSCPTSGTTLIKSGKLGGPQQGRPLRAGLQHLAPTARHSLMTGLAQLSTPAAGRYRLLQIHLAPCIAIQPHDTHSSAQDASTQTAWTLPRRRVRCKRSTPAGAHLDSTDPSGTSPLQRTTLCPSSPGISPPPSLTVPPVHQVPHGFVPPPPPPPLPFSPTSKAAPLPTPQMQVASTAQAGKQNAAPQPNPQIQDASTARA